MQPKLNTESQVTLPINEYKAQQNIYPNQRIRQLSEKTHTEVGGGNGEALVSRGNRGGRRRRE
jgi:hypothetical protein